MGRTLNEVRSNRTETGQAVESLLGGQRDLPRSAVARRVAVDLLAGVVDRPEADVEAIGLVNRVRVVDANDAGRVWIGRGHDVVERPRVRLVRLVQGRVEEAQRRARGLVGVRDDAGEQRRCEARATLLELVVVGAVREGLGQPDQHPALCVGVHRDVRLDPQWLRSEQGLVAQRERRRHHRSLVIRLHVAVARAAATSRLPGKRARRRRGRTAVGRRHANAERLLRRRPAVLGQAGVAAANF